MPIDFRSIGGANSVTLNTSQVITGLKKFTVPVTMMKGEPYFNAAGYGVVGDGVTDDYPALNAMLNDIRALPQTAPFLARGAWAYVPRGIYRLSQTLNIDRGMVFQGAGSGGWYAATIFRPDEGVGAFVVKSNITSGDPTHGRGDWSKLCHFSIWGQGTTSGAINHGIKIDAKCHLEDIYITNIKGDGVHNLNSVGVTGDGSLNYWVNLRADYLGGTGFYDNGGDAQAGTRINCSAAGCGGWGFYDHSSYGNTFVGCHTQANALGGYHLRKGILLHPYAEGGQIPTIDLGDEGLSISGGSFSADANTGAAISSGGNEFIVHSGQAIKLNRDATGFSIKRFSAGSVQPFVQFYDELGGQMVRWDCNGRLGIGSGPGARILTLVETANSGGVSVAAPTRTAANDKTGFSFVAGAGSSATINHYAPATAGTYSDAVEVAAPGNGNIVLAPGGTGKVLCSKGIGVGNSAGGSTLGTVVKKMEVFDANGASLGFVPIYNTIT